MKMPPLKLPPKIDIEGIEAVWLLAFAKRQLERFKKLYPFGVRRFNLPDGEEVTIWWGNFRDRIRIIAAAGAGGFLVLLHLGDGVYQGWGRDTSGAAKKLVDIPQPDEGTVLFLSFYRRGAAYAAEYGFTNQAPVIPQFGFRTLPPFSKASPYFRRAEDLPDQRGEGFEINGNVSFGPRTRRYSGSRYLLGGLGTTELYDYNDRIVLDDTPGSIDLPENLGEAEVGSSGNVGARFLDEDTVQFARASVLSGVPGMYTREYSIAGSPPTGGTPDTPVVRQTRRWQGGVGVGGTHASPIALGVEGDFSLDFGADGGTETFGSSGGSFNSPLGTLGCPPYISPGYIIGNNPGVSGPTAAISVVCQPGDIELHNDTMEFGKGYLCFVYAYPVWIAGVDYWHVYTASLKAVLTSPPTNIYDFDANYPLTTTLTRRVIDSSGAQLSVTSGGWVQTDETPTYADTPGTFKVFVPLGGGLVSGSPWIAGYSVEFGPGFTTFISPAQWMPNMGTVHEYPQHGYSFTSSVVNQSPFSVGALARLRWYVASDESGTYFVMADGASTAKVYTVKLGSSATPELLVDPIEESAETQFPFEDAFNNFTTGAP